jgi:hypothetical protein
MAASPLRHVHLTIAPGHGHLTIAPGRHATAFPWWRALRGGPRRRHIAMMFVHT